MAQFNEILQEMQDLYERKNHDYGDSFSTSYRLFGLVAPLVRINDKVNRLNKLYKSDAKVAESVRDTLIDLANYAVMTVMELDKSTDDVTKEIERHHGKDDIKSIRDSLLKLKAYGGEKAIDLEYLD